MTRSEYGVLDGRTKYLFLRNVLSPKTVANRGEALRHLRFRAVRYSRRPCFVGSEGGCLSFGWTSNPQPRLFKDTKGNPIPYYFTLSLLLGELSGLVKRYLPKDWEEARETARANGYRLIGSGFGPPDVPIISFQEPIFSSVAINKDTTCRSHVDAKNASGLGCMTVFGKFQRGAFCMPRLRLVFDVQPGDVLVADTNNEQHGNLDGPDGERISVVAYLTELKNRVM